MYQEKITILRHLQERGGSLTVQNFVELGLTDKAFVVAVQSLSRLGLVEQDGLTQAISFGAPVSLSLTKAGTSAIKET
jgi:DNA-binding IclR family transcriptional regulator